MTRRFANPFSQGSDVLQVLVMTSKAVLAQAQALAHAYSAVSEQRLTPRAV
jgi:hypothetical protein